MILIISLLSSGVIKDQLPCTEFLGKKWVEKLLRKMLIVNQWKSILLALSRSRDERKLYKKPVEISFLHQFNFSSVLSLLAF